MVLVMATFLTDDIQKGPDTTVVKQDHHQSQNGIKGTHKHKVNRVINPLESKRKHGYTFLLLWIQLLFLRKNG